ncbi:vacuolar protein sorting-associated protein 60.2-like isoform X2 [Aegilops tauschii subsp. strangulata]|uniref:Charged multivesicular body protein 5 n=2 Tax=Aegilops tauschii subsp. strangulata TaxID=200361 RepID=A0A452XIK1_AEGTS|nr:vacuolar protein sorting-associated protein 60.2-like isoform X2 [Aegilops tauschii subsp. strangulata]
MKCPQHAAATSSSPLFAGARRSTLPPINVDKSPSKRLSQKMTAKKAANKELKGMMKTVRIEDIDSMHDEMMDLMDASNEIQETLGRSYNVPDDIDEEQLMGELDALEADMDFESNSVPSYLQPDKETDLDSELNLPAAPSGHATIPANRQQEDELGLPTVPHASIPPGQEGEVGLPRIQ